MEFDIKNNLLKTTVGDNRLGQKNIKATIDDSLVTSMGQKNLDMDLEGEASTKLKKEKQEQEKKKKNLKLAEDEKKSASQKKQEIVRDPIKLLKLL